MFTTAELFDLTQVPAPLQSLLEPQWPWEILAALDHFLETLEPGHLGQVHPTAVLEDNVYLAPTAKVGPHAYIKGPSWIGEGSEIGHSAYLRGHVILAKDNLVLHSSEVKHALLLPRARLPHFNYVGDSVIGSGATLGAGVKLANFKTFGNEITIEDQKTGLRKFGAAIGDDVFIGCNAVTSPGTVIGPRTLVYNGAMLRGVYPADSVVKFKQTLETVPRR